MAKSIVTPSVVSQDKPPLHLIFKFTCVIRLITLGFWNGAKRPGRTLMGWQETGETKEKVVGGLLRHLAALEDGHRYDEVSGEDHLQNLGCNVIMYIWLELTGMWKHD